MEERELISLLRLIEVSGIGPVRIRSLVQLFKTPSEVFRASIQDLCRVDRIDLKLAQAIVSFGPTSFAEQQLGKAEKQKVKIMTFWDGEFPPLLKRIYDPPVLLFVRGSFLGSDADAVAVVGTRTPTTYGRKVAEDLGSHLAQARLTVVSGFAKGIDTIAHRAALAAGGRTVAVLGNGVDVVYPAENRRLLADFGDHGVMVSEFPLGTQPDAGNFPRRNRIISGLCHATVVVEAGDKSGALLTALNAVDQNREVFAVPGRLTDRKSRGCLRLIRLGAIPVQSPEQILETINPKLKFPRKAVQQDMKLDLSQEEMNVYEVLSDEPLYVDDIARLAELDSSSVLGILLSLELKGAISQLGGKHFVRM